MSFDLRKEEYVFKHTVDNTPNMSKEMFREHFHPNYELLFFIRGRADFLLRQKVYHLEHHSLLLIKPGSYHNIIIREVVPYERIVIRFSPDAIPSPLNARLSQLPDVFNIRGSLLEEELLHLDKYASEADAGVREGVFLSALNIILLLLSASSSLSRREDKVNTSLARIIEYIESGLTDIHTVEDIASGLNMSVSTVNKVFREQLQTPVMKYVRTQKCMLAKNLILDGVPAYEAAEKAGFDYYSTFYRAYRSVFNDSPVNSFTQAVSAPTPQQ